MTIESIFTDADLHVALIKLERIFQADEGTPEAAEREVLVTLIEAYETSHFAIATKDPE